MRFLNKKAAIAIGCLLFTLAFVTPSLMKADEWNLATKFSVNHSFEVPGMVLQPNTTYVIKVLDSPSNRNVVQIYNEDQTRMLTMFLTISSERMEPTDKTLFTFVETEPAYPLPIREWFYPGRILGHEFVYPKDQAMKIAQHALSPVLAADNTDLHDLSSIDVESLGPIREQAPVTASASNITKTETPQVLEEKPAPTVEETSPVEEPEVSQESPDNAGQIAQNTAPEPDFNSNEEVQQQEPVEPTAEPGEAPAYTGQELPATAGELPLVALIGALCLGAGLGLKVLSARS